jgi:hypothetical protein
MFGTSINVRGMPARGMTMLQSTMRIGRFPYEHAESSSEPEPGSVPLTEVELPPPVEPLKFTLKSSSIARPSDCKMI